MVLYLHDVMPFCFHINLETPRYGFLFTDKDKSWMTTKVTKVFVRETTAKIGFRITSSDYRHIAIAIDRKFIRGSNAEQYDDSEDDDPEDAADQKSNGEVREQREQPTDAFDADDVQTEKVGQETTLRQERPQPAPTLIHRHRIEDDCCNGNNRANDQHPCP